MTPTEVLNNEHRIIERMLSCLEKIASLCETTGKLEKQAAHDAVLFFRQFADRIHHDKEEDHLFPLIEAKAVPREGGPTGVLLLEHEGSRAHVRAMDGAIDAASAGNAEAAKRFVAHARAYVGLVREHIQREELCVFPLADEALDEEDKRVLTELFEKADREEIGRQTHQACIDIANRLAERFGVSLAVSPAGRETKRCSCWSYAELSEQKRVIERQNDVMSRDLEIARQIQRALIPRKRNDVRGLQIAFDYQPVVQVGGDILDIVPVPGGRALLFVGDVVGHGVRAALAMSAVKAALLSAVKSDPWPGSVLPDVNEVVGEMFYNQVLPQFVTAACCLVDPARAKAEITLAGHPSPLWFRAALGEVLQVGVAGLPLGIDGAGAYEVAAIALEPGDVLLLFTDGLVEALDPGERQYGYQRLENRVLEHGGRAAGELLAAIEADLQAFQGGHVMTDDLALLVVKFVGVPTGISSPDASIARMSS